MEAFGRFVLDVACSNASRRKSQCEKFLPDLGLFERNKRTAFGNATQGFSLFSSAAYGRKDVMFSDETKTLLRVMGSYTSWLGPSYTTMLQAFECEEEYEKNKSEESKREQ
ncbi:hypothetical protein JZ751_013716 [Albula glossodonta]|uniref:Transferrin-like domain-containing protein n=1 Tax=Albula glossodonta TaxID=121402 RepID=A0A8T2NW82_9TELE|nr:hypothetical protein JZ751_013716 [Albula glossodonta]